MDDDDDAADYLPTPEEIEAGCEAIRANWSPRQRRRRSAMPQAQVTIPMIADEWERGGKYHDAE